MTAVAFHTPKVERTLRDKAKLSPEQAEGLADAFVEVFQGNIATKADAEALRLSRKADIEALRLSTRSDLREAESRREAKTEATEADIIDWMFGTIGFQTPIILGAVINLARVMR